MTDLAPPAAEPAGEGSVLDLPVTDALDGQRLDIFLRRSVPGMSRARLAFLVRAGHVRRDTQTITDPSAKVRQGEAFRVVIPPPDRALPEPEDLPIAILYEDASLLVVDKAPGMVVHPAQGNRSGTLVNALLHHCGDSLSGIGGVRRPGIVHRIDKDTSGLMVVAKTDRAHHALAHQLADRSLSRRYLALVWGLPDRVEGTVDAPIGRHPTERKKMAVVADGKPARTHWRVLRAFTAGAAAPLCSLIECRLDTGRTHQIRVHMAHCGHPLIGDPLYGRSRNPQRRRDLEGVSATALAALADFPRQALHATALQLTHPDDGRPCCFESPIPPDFQGLLAELE